MLTVGDYILTPDICIERKSVKDLVSSFKDGRLYSQCEAMTQFYKHVMILIEFEQNKAFSLEVGDIPRETTQSCNITTLRLLLRCRQISDKTISSPSWFYYR